ncbi:MAG: hypothetical protein NC311_09145 [Muribaculaceae bacterium]|nr:hypothetical protein [Muribaculaceae bacterium]
MFNFNMFSAAQWKMLTHAHVYGFAGFVFGILILAAIPMYVATTVLIIRTQQPIVTINTTCITKIFNAVFPRPAVPTTDEIAPAPDDTTTPESDTPKFPPNMPNEMRGAFIRARQHIDQFNTSAFNITDPTTVPTDMPSDINTDELPLPVDFDFDDDPDSDSAMQIIDTPTFTDIDFGDDDQTTEISEPDNPTDTTLPITPSQTFVMHDIIQYLNDNGKITSTKKDLILTDTHIIAIHDDSDFWIADPENWFAAGKQKPSPIIDLIKESAITGLKPIIYLAQTNIMDIDNVRNTWSQMGVISITDLDQLPA